VVEVKNSAKVALLSFNRTDVFLYDVMKQVNVLCHDFTPTRKALDFKHAPQ